MANREMKYSGVEWIGEIPKRWEVMKFKYVMKKDKKIAKKYNNENVISLTKSGVIIRDLENPFGKMPASFDGYQHVEEGDLLLCLFDIDVTPRCVGIVKNNGVTSPAYSRYKLMDGFDINYYNYLLTYLDDEKILLSYTKSLRNTLTDEYFGAVSTIKPSLLEQQKIAAFLDGKVAHINNIIEDTKKSIENLKAYKQSFITETVTKGLDSNVEMKDSGIEWIRKIPKHWKVSKLKYIKDNEKYAIVDGPFGSDMKVNDYISTGIPITQLNNISPMKHELKNLKFVSEEKAESLKRHQIFPNDLLVAKMMPAGRTCIVSNEYEKYMLSSDSIRVKVDSEMANSIYVAYHLNALNTHQAEMYSKGTTRIRINLGIVNNYFVLLPPLEEQNLIAEYLNNSVMELDKILRDKEQLIIDLESYKKSLIYEYVTGKKEVK